MSLVDDRREALIEAHRLSRVKPGAECEEIAQAADAAAAHLIAFMRRQGDFALGLLQAASYLLSGTAGEEDDTKYRAENMADRAIRAAPNNPDILRRAYTIFLRLSPDAARSEADIILTDSNWETLPKRELLE
jgi:hypothetical protein